MISAPLPENEQDRLDWLDKLEILDTLEEQAYDDLTLLAAQICSTPIALVSLVDRERQWFKSHHGLPARQTPRDRAFCAHAILDDELFIVEDSSADPRFHDNPLATGAPHVRFYAGAPLVLADNIRLGTLCVIDTVQRELSTAQKQALAALARQVISQLELRLKVSELRSLDRAKDQFISMVSHELRTPLTSIKGALSMLNQSTTDISAAQRRELLDIGYRNSNRLLNIVNDILDIAKLQAGKLDLQLDTVEATDLVQRAVDLHRIYVEDCGCEVALKLPDDDTAVWLRGDQQRLLQVLGNLISNAAKFTCQGDIIELAVCTNGEKVHLSVTDHGPGIPPEAQEKLFAPFSQLHTPSSRKRPGTGLGLSISRQIVELHQGQIGCHSVPNVRTTFSIGLPVLAQPAAETPAGTQRSGAA